MCSRCRAASRTTAARSDDTQHQLRPRQTARGPVGHASPACQAAGEATAPRCRHLGAYASHKTLPMVNELHSLASCVPLRHDSQPMTAVASHHLTVLRFLAHLSAHCIGLPCKELTVEHTSFDLSWLAPSVTKVSLRACIVRRPLLETLRCSKKLWQLCYIAALPGRRWRVTGDVRWSYCMSTESSGDEQQPSPSDLCGPLLSKAHILAAAQHLLCRSHVQLGLKRGDDGAEPLLFRLRDECSFLDPDEPLTDEDCYADVDVSIPEAGRRRQARPMTVRRILTRKSSMTVTSTRTTRMTATAIA